MNRVNKYVAAAFVALSIFVGPVLYAQMKIIPKQESDSSATKARDLSRQIKFVRNLINSGKFDEALQLVAKLESAYGVMPEFTNVRKQIYYAQKDYKSLRQLVMDEFKSNPDDFNGLCQLGEIYFLTDSLDLAAATWEKAFQNSGLSQLNYFTLANYYRKYGFYDEAASVFKRGRTLLNQPGIFGDELADIYISQRNYAQAVEEYLSLLNIDGAPQQAEYLSRQIVSIYQQADNQAQIIQKIKNVIKDNPDVPEYYLILGDLNIKSNNLREAFDNYKQAEKLSAKKGFFLENFIALCYENQEYQMAIEAADYYFEGKNARPSPDITITKAKSLAALGSYQPAFDLLQMLKDSNNDKGIQAEAIYAIGEIYYVKLHDSKAAADNFLNLYKNYKPYGFFNEAAVKLAEISIKENRYAEAVEYLNNVKTDNKRNKDLTELAGFLKAETGFYDKDFESAKTQYNDLMRQFPNGFYVNDCLDRLSILIDAADDSVLFVIADAARLKFSDRLDSAIVRMKEAAERVDSKAYEYVVFNLAGYYAEAGLWDTAVGAYEHYQTAFPEGVYIDRALFNLARIYNEKIGRRDKADQLLNRLMTDFPASPLIEKARLYLNSNKAS